MATRVIPFLCMVLCLALSVEAFVPTSFPPGAQKSWSRQADTVGATALYANGRFRAKIKSIFRRGDKKEANGAVESKPAKSATAKLDKVEKDPKTEPKKPSPKAAPPRKTLSVSSDTFVVAEPRVVQKTVAEQLDDLLDAGNPQAAMTLLETTRYLHDELYWRLVRVHYELHQECTSAQERYQQQYLQKGVDLARMGLEDDKFPATRGELLKWKGLLLQTQLELGGSDHTLGPDSPSNTVLAQQCLDEASRLLPKDDSIPQALSKFK